MTVAAVVGGTVVLPHHVADTDVVIEGERIQSVGRAAAGGGTVIDASDCFVLPGGVDPHTHLMDGLEAATRAAALGGTTTVLSFTNPREGEGDLDCFRRRRAQLDAGGAVVDVGLHAMVYDPEGASPEDIATFREEGATAFKVFLAYSDLGIMCSAERLLELMKVATETGLITQVHCEDGAHIEALVREAVAEGRRGPRAYADTRPPVVEEEAVITALEAAARSGARCHLVHLSSASALEQVRMARDREHFVLAEVCLHHLVLDDEAYDSPEAGRYLVAPPLRPRRHVEALWDGLVDGTVHVVGSDHCQIRTAMPAELTDTGESCCYGLAGVGARLPVLLSEGLDRGVPIERLVEVAAFAPAFFFGLDDRKGSLAPGADADIVVWDPEPETLVTQDTFEDGTGDSVYVGRRLHGRVRDVISRGRLLVQDGVLVEGTAGGRFLSPRRRQFWGPYRLL